jgi:predicted dehydrogenase
MTIRDGFRQTSPELRSTPLSVLYSVLEDAKEYEGYL